MSGFIMRLLSLVSLVVLISAMTVTAKDSPNKESNVKNHDLMTKLGLSKRPIAPNHHRKRLASESRGSNADSHMFVIKLPPNPFYYSHFKPLNGLNPVKKLSMGFRSNGKPGKIYHWNLPTLNKMAENRRHLSRLSDSGNDVITVLKPSSKWTVTDPIATNRHDKFKTSIHGYHNRKTQLKLEKPVMSYYAPVQQTVSSPQKPKINKYFSGNGKPHSFYVIEKSKKPIKYHRLLT